MKYNVDVDLKPRPVLQELIEDLTNKMLAQKQVLADCGEYADPALVQGLKADIRLLDQVIERCYAQQELIDMRNHKGEHPRMGATDVCPLIPISGITMEETIKYAHKLSKKVGEELNIPVYCYEYAATKKDRQNLANCRKGEYEGLQKKLLDKNWKPDYGPSTYNESVAKSGATAISARDFLVAYNINLNTTSTRRANAIAFDIREAGRIKRDKNKINGKILKDKKGNPLRQPGLFKYVKGIGWFIEEYGVAQISYNLTNINISPLHEVFDKTCEKAQKRGVEPDRIIFADKMANAEHLARHKLADLFIDTFPYTAHTTCSDALWSSLPVITHIGQSFASRVSASLLTAIGLSELITKTEKEYEELTFKIANNKSLLNEIKKKLNKNRLIKPLFNTKLFTKNIESAFVIMHERYHSNIMVKNIEIK